MCKIKRAYHPSPLFTLYTPSKSRCEFHRYTTEEFVFVCVLAAITTTRVSWISPVTSFLPDKRREHRTQTLDSDKEGLYRPTHTHTHRALCYFSCSPPLGHPQRDWHPCIHQLCIHICFTAYCLYQQIWPLPVSHRYTHPATSTCTHTRKCTHFKSDIIQSL